MWEREIKYNKREMYEKRWELEMERENKKEMKEREWEKEKEKSKREMKERK